jgi:catechol 2,3-dioxygenase-like lactoylglutathione lyase family enzyme
MAEMLDGYSSEAVAPDERPRWRGINHLALVTNDMDATVRFYHGVLGMPLVATLEAGPMKHYFFEIGVQNTLAFFMWDGTDVGTLDKPAGVPPDFATQFDHLSFNLPDEEALRSLQDRLVRNLVEVTDVVDHGFIGSIYFTDPNGIALEASCWVVDPTGRPADYADTRVLFTDPEPVAAVHELRRQGELEWTPSTQLVDEGADPA